MEIAITSFKTLIAVLFHLQGFRRDQIVPHLGGETDRIKIFVILLLFLIVLLPAQGLKASVGTEAAAFLKIDAGARAAAMGGAFTAIADDASSIFYNPAGPILMESDELFFSHNQWIEELNTEHISYIHPVSDKLAYFAGFSTLISPMINSYDTGGNTTGSFNVVDRMLGVGISLVEKGVKAGYFLKVITQEAYNEKGMAYAGDLGIIETYENFRFGLSAQNLGTKMKIYEEEFELPAIYRGGAAYRFIDKYWLAGEVVKMGEADTAFSLGAEGEFDLSQNGKAYLRCGYNSGRSENSGSGVSAGLGFSVSKFILDYAFSPFGDLGSVHRLNLALKFGKGRGSSFRKKYDNAKFDKLDSKADEVFEEPVIADRQYVKEQSIPESYEAYLEYAEDYLAQRDYENAFNEFGKASESISIDDGRQVYILERQGLILLKQNNYSRCKRFYSAAIKTAKSLNIADKNVVNAYLGLAYCQKKTGGEKWAIINYKAVLKLTKDSNTKLRIEKALNKLESPQ
ncbi:MAG: PorV/PorQ family protein [Elusimicrobia bacterium]|nr:PorV/PorQ family protein [Elusimicrobiota bacterium]